MDIGRFGIGFALFTFFLGKRKIKNSGNFGS